MENGQLNLENVADIATITALIVAALAFITSQFSLSAKVKRLEDLKVYARMYNEIYPGHRHKDREEGKERGISPVKDTAVRYKQTLDSLHLYATFGLGNVLLWSLFGYYPTVFSIMFGADAFIRGKEFWWILVIVGILWGVACVGGMICLRKNLSRKAEKVTDSDLDLILNYPQQRESEPDKSLDKDAVEDGGSVKSQLVSPKQGDCRISKFGFLALLVLMTFQRRK